MVEGGGEHDSIPRLLNLWLPTSAAPFPEGIPLRGGRREPVMGPEHAVFGKREQLCTLAKGVGADTTREKTCVALNFKGVWRCRVGVGRREKPHRSHVDMGQTALGVCKWGRRDATIRRDTTPCFLGGDPRLDTTENDRAEMLSSTSSRGSPRGMREDKRWHRRKGRNVHTGQGQSFQLLDALKFLAHAP
jgi:hypothetical protein